MALTSHFNVQCNDLRFLGLIWTFRAIYADKEYSKWRTGYDYPQNQLRNVARQTSLTHYTLSLDVDVILAPGEKKIFLLKERF